MSARGTLGPSLRRKLRGDPGELPAQPLMTLVPVVARVPQQANREGHGLNRLCNPGETELTFQYSRKRGGEREQRIAVQRGQDADKRRGDLRVLPDGQVGLR